MSWLSLGFRRCRPRWPSSIIPRASSTSSSQQPNTANATKSHESQSVRTLMELLDLPNPAAVHKLLGSRGKHVLAEYAEDLRHSYEQLRKMRYQRSDVLQNPKVLAKNALTIYNHYHVLHEIGFRTVDIPAINRYISIINRSVDDLKSLALIDPQLDLPQRLADYLHVRLDPRRKYDTAAPVRQLRRVVFNTFLSEHLQMSESEQDRIWTTYTNLRNKSFRSMYGAVRLCEELVGMDRERIKQHPYVLYADPDNIRQICALGTLGGIEARHLIWRRPKIMMTNCRNLLRVEQVIREFGVPDKAFGSCVEIFTLSPQTIHERLCDLRKVREFEVLVNHPRVLRLVHYQMKARARLEYLRKMKVNCISLHVLSSGATAFERYARTGVDRTKGMDIVLMITQRFAERTNAEVRLTLNRHPNWCHVSAVSVKRVLDWLTAQGYEDDCIYENLHLLLYPLPRIKQQLTNIEESPADRWPVAPADMTPSQRLQMCLYLIELEFHFEGDGIWLEPVTDATVCAPVSGETEFEMLGDYRKTLGPLQPDNDNCSEVAPPMDSMMVA